MGDGSLALILDIGKLMHQAEIGEQALKGAATV
jgi:chemotaxis protein histidine kinase CheA